MAVEGVRSVEIPRVSGLSPEQFHRLEKEIFRNISFGTFEHWLIVLPDQGVLHKSKASHYHRRS